MKAKVFYLTLIFFLSLMFTNAGCAFSQGDFSETQTQKFIKKYEPMVDRTLRAYNKEDCAEFYKDFTGARQKKTEAVFKAIWIDGYRMQFGDFVSRTLVPDKCDFNDVHPLLVYKAIFSKNDNVEIKVVFSKEDDGYKIFYLRFDKLLKATHE